jgi:hypothetical protein
MLLHLGQVEIASQGRAHAQQEAFLTEVPKWN